MSTPTVNPTTWSKSLLLKWFIVIISPILVLCLPVQGAFTQPIRTFFAMTVCAILIFALEVMPNFVASILLPAAYVFFGLVPGAVAWGPWTSTMPWMMVSSFVLAIILESTGILKRISYWCMIKTGGTYRGIVFGLAIAGIICSFLAPATLLIAMAALVYGICKSLDLGKSKAAAGITLNTAMVMTTCMFFIYSPGQMGLIFNSATSVIPIQVTYTEMLLHQWVYLPMIFVFTYINAKLCKPEGDLQGKSFFETEYARLGKMSAAEKKSVAIMLALLLFLLTGSLHKIDMSWGFILAGCLFYFPGINVGTPEDIRRTDFSFIFFITACLSIGTVSTVLGVGQLISNLLVPMLSKACSIGAIALVWFFAVLINFLLTPLAALSLVGAPIAQIAVDLNINPLVFMYTFYNGIDQVLLPYEFVTNLIFFSFGLVHLKDFVKLYGIKMVLSFIWLMLLVIPYWHLIGLI